MIQADEDTQRLLHALLAAFRKADLHGLAMEMNSLSGEPTVWAFKRKLSTIDYLMKIRPPTEGQERIFCGPLQKFKDRIEELTS